MHQLFIDCMKAYGSVSKEVLYSMLIDIWYPHEFGWLNPEESDGRGT
jgi:hypothetical protein